MVLVRWRLSICMIVTDYQVRPVCSCYSEREEKIWPRVLEVAGAVSQTNDGWLYVISPDRSLMILITRQTVSPASPATIRGGETPLLSEVCLEYLRWVAV